MTELRFTEFDWVIDPAEPKNTGGRRSVPAITLRTMSSGKSPRIVLSKAAREAIGMPSRVIVKYTRTAIAVRAALPDEAGARPMGKTGHIGAAALLYRLGLKAFDSFVIDAKVEQGYVWAELPPQMVMRQKMRGAA